jgi:hypothetical protein
MQLVSTKGKTHPRKRPKELFFKLLFLKIKKREKKREKLIFGLSCLAVP